MSFCCIFLLLDGCSALRDLAQSIKKPRLSVTDVRVKGYDFNGIELTFDVTVDNPNALSVQMQSYDYALDINQQTFANGQQQNQTRIEASGASTFQVPMQLSYRDVYRTVEDLANSDEAEYEFKSTFSFELPGIGITKVPVRKSGKIPLLHLPTIRINNLQVNNLSLNSARLTLDMEFENPNGIGFNIDGFDYSLDINENQWVKGKALAGASITKNGVTELEIPITLNIAQMGMSAFNLLSGSSNVNYELNGQFSLEADHPLLGNTDFSFNREGRVSMARGE